jgi:hypothetical protein
MKTVISVSLGSSTRNKASDRAFAGVPFHLERIGTDGDAAKAARLIAEYDGKVDAIGLGGMDRYLVVGNRRYELRQAGKLARQAKVTPVVDGSGIKRVLEPLMIRRLAQEGTLEVAGQRVLVLAGVDRPGMAEVFPELGAKAVYGDLLFAVGVPVPLHSLGQVKLLAAICLPVLRLLPMSMLYPTGSKQEHTKPKHERHFQEADIIAGDFVFIKRYMPDDLRGKVIVTNTTRAEDIEALRKRGVKLLITTTPPIGGESFGTNVLEGVLVALSGKRPEELTEQDYLQFAEDVGWQPGVTHLG